jgi:hypothetical protein
MHNLNTSFQQSLQYNLAGACKENNLHAFKSLLLSNDYSHYDRTQLGNIAFLAAYMDGNDDFIRYLIIDYRIERTALVNRFLTEQTLCFFNQRKLMTELEQLPTNKKYSNFVKI